MMRIIFCLIFFVSALGYSQNAHSPFELERFENYSEVEISKESINQSMEVQLLLEYHLEYKKERAKKPSNYFPKPTERQGEISSKLREEFPMFWGNKLIDFLQNGCSNENLQGLLSIQEKNRILLAYQFMAANALEDTDKEKLCLQGLLREGMISDVTKTWGNTAVVSAQGFESILTNGMQDLIAIRYVQLIEGKGKDIAIANKFIQKCGLNEEAIAFGNMWFAPTLEKNVISPFKARLQVVGIGFAFSASADGATLSSVAQSVSKVMAQNPSDEGLINSYSYLQKALEESGKKNLASQLKRYISAQGK